MDGLWTPVIFCAGVKRMYLGHDTGAILVSIQYMMQLLPMHFSWNMYDAFWNTLIDFSWIMYVPWNFFIDFSWNVSCFALWYVFESIQDDFDVVSKWLMKFDDFWNSDVMFEHWIWCLKLIKTLIFAQFFWTYDIWWMGLIWRYFLSNAYTMLVDLMIALLCMISHSMNCVFP